VKHAKIEDLYTVMVLMLHSHKFLN